MFIVDQLILGGSSSEPLTKQNICFELWKVKMKFNYKLLLVAIVIMVITLNIPYIHRAFNALTEVKNSQYTDILKNIERYPDDSTLRSIIQASLKDDQIIGAEYRLYFDYLISKYGSFITGPSPDQVNQFSKENLKQKLELKS